MVEVTKRKKVFTTVDGTTGKAVIENSLLTVELNGQTSTLPLQDASDAYAVDNILYQNFGMKFCTQETCEFKGDGFRGVISGVADKGKDIRETTVSYLSAYTEDKNISIMINELLGAPVHHYNAAPRQAEKMITRKMTAKEVAIRG